MSCTPLEIVVALGCYQLVGPWVIFSGKWMSVAHMCYVWTGLWLCVSMARLCHGAESRSVIIFTSHTM